MTDYVERQPPRRHRGRVLAAVLFGVLLLAAGGLLGKWFLEEYLPASKVRTLAETRVPDWVDVQIIPVDGDSRRGEQLEDIKDIMIHYVANPGTTAQQNHDWYCNAASEVSSHFLVGLDGEIIQCIPLEEKSSATNYRNKDTISIEVCHPDESGKFTDESYRSLVKLTAWLEEVCGLQEEHIIRHFDVTGKDCPRYFVQHEDAWAQFKKDVRSNRP